MSKKRRIFDPEPKKPLYKILRDSANKVTAGLQEVPIDNFQEHTRIVYGGLGRLPLVPITRQAIINDDLATINYYSTPPRFGVIPKELLNEIDQLESQLNSLKVYEKSVAAWNKAHPPS